MKMVIVFIFGVLFGISALAAEAPKKGECFSDNTGCLEDQSGAHFTLPSNQRGPMGPGISVPHASSCTFGCDTPLSAVELGANTRSTGGGSINE